MNMNLAARMKKTETKLKKAFRLKLLKLCKTRTKKSSLDMLNFYVISIDHDMVNALTALLRAGANSKLHQKKTKLQNVKFLPKTWVAPNYRLTISDQKFKIITSGIREQNKGATRLQRQQMEMDLVTRKK